MRFFFILTFNNWCHVYLLHSELCDKALRIESITASSSSLNYQPIEAQLDSSSCWKPLTDNDPNDYLQVDLGSVKLLQRIDTRALTSQSYVESYKIQYSTDGVKWEYYPNFDGTPKVLTYYSHKRFCLYGPLASHGRMTSKVQRALRSNKINLKELRNVFRD